jgi:esterase/lipase superfamily enzyme
VINWPSAERSINLGEGTTRDIRSTMTRYLIAVFLTLGLAACEPRGQIVVDPAADKVGKVESIFIGTTRGPDPKTGEEFGSARSRSTRFARLDVSVPPERVAGVIEWPKPRKKPDPQHHFLTTSETVYAGAADFRSAVHQAIQREAGRRGEVVVFVHGFNNNFPEGAYRLAQLGHDLAMNAVLVHYSWPSLAHPLGYAYDRDSALFSRDGLESLLKEVDAAGARHIVIVAHSMGAALTMETLRQISIAGNNRLKSKITGVVLVSPDVDVDVFHAQADRIVPLPQPFIIFTSRKDRALALSARLSGQKERLGNIADVSRLSDLKVTFLDTTAFSTGVGHFNLGNSPALLSILGRLPDIDSALAGDQTGRTGLLPGAVLSVRSATEIILSPVTALAGGTQ